MIAVWGGVRIASDSAGSTEVQAFTVLTTIGLLSVVALHVDHRLDVGRWYRSSDITRVRVAVIIVGDLAVVILSLQVWVLAVALVHLTAALFTIGIESGNWGFERSR